MGSFCLISFVSEDELFKRYRLLGILNAGLRGFIIPHMPGYVWGTVSNMGLTEHDVSGCRVCIPSISDNGDIVVKKMVKAVRRARRYGSDVLVIEPQIDINIREEDLNMRISRGDFYPPAALMDAAMNVSALMGIDFRRSNICVADACTPIGIVVTELLLEEAAYLTLCTTERNKILKRIGSYISKTGLSPSVVSNYKKAMRECDILIYTGNMDLTEITSYVHRKMLVVNLTGRKVSTYKDLLMIDEVILRGGREPVISGDNIDINIFLTSRLWEGALLTLTDMDTKLCSAEKARKISNTAKKLGVRVSSVIGNGRMLDRESIYRYR